MTEPNMTDKETAAYLREWVKTGEHGIYGWPTDMCGYDQHIRFVEYRNKHWKGYAHGTFNDFVLGYADLLDPPVPSKVEDGRHLLSC